MTLEDAMQLSIDACPGLPPFEREYRFHPDRRWRFDFAIPSHLVAIEVEGGVWVEGRHTRGAGFIRDAEKYNAAALLGWRVFRVTTADLWEGRGRRRRLAAGALDLLERIRDELLSR